MQSVEAKKTLLASFSPISDFIAQNLIITAVIIFGTAFAAIFDVVSVLLIIPITSGFGDWGNDAQPMVAVLEQLGFNQEANIQFWLFWLVLMVSLRVAFQILVKYLTTRFANRFVIALQASYFSRTVSRRAEKKAGSNRERSIGRMTHDMFNESVNASRVLLSVFMIIESAFAMLAMVVGLYLVDPATATFLLVVMLVFYTLVLVILGPSAAKLGVYRVKLNQFVTARFQYLVFYEPSRTDMLVRATIKALDGLLRNVVILSVVKQIPKFSGELLIISMVCLLFVSNIDNTSNMIQFIAKISVFVMAGQRILTFMNQFSTQVINLLTLRRSVELFRIAA